MGSGKNIPESCHWLYSEETQAIVWPVLLASFNRKEACSSIHSANTIRWYFDFKILSVTGNVLETMYGQLKIRQNQYNKHNQERSNVKLQHLDKA